MYKLSGTAQSQINEIAAYWYSVSGSREATKKVLMAIRAKMKQLGTNSATGTPIENTSSRVGYATQKMRFAIYYRQTGPKSIKVVAIKDTKQERPKPVELESRD